VVGFATIEALRSKACGLPLLRIVGLSGENVALCVRCSYQGRKPRHELQSLRIMTPGACEVSLPSVTRRLIQEFVAQPGRHRAPPERPEQLTEREREVLGLVALGLSNQEIAERARDQPRHREDARQPDDDETARPRPRTAGRNRLRERPRPRPAVAAGCHAGGSSRPRFVRGQEVPPLPLWREVLIHCRFVGSALVIAGDVRLRRGP